MGKLVRRVFRKIRRETLDQSWSAQTLEREEEDLQAEKESQLLQEHGKFATQMVLMQSLMTKKNLITYQLNEHLDSEPTSFVSLYSDICADGVGSLPFNSELLDEAIEAACEEGHEGEMRRTGSSGLRFLQEHLRGVPDPSGAPASQGEGVEATQRVDAEEVSLHTNKLDDAVMQG